MVVFISWSGPRSRKVAEALTNWLGDVVQAVEPWMSTDIEKGKRWADEIMAGLEQAPVGILCLTRDNLGSKWLHFEAGALAKARVAHAYTFLLDINPAEVEFPLAMFQHTSIARDEVFKLLQSINGCLTNHDEKSLSEERLARNFDRCWPELENKLQEAVKLPVQSPTPIRSSDEMLQEALELLRVQGSEIAALRKVAESTRNQAVFSTDSPANSGIIRPGSPLKQFSPEELSSESDPFSNDDSSHSNRKRRRIHNFDELVELWPALLMRIRKKIGVVAVAYLHNARPVAFTDDDIVLEFSKSFHWEQAFEAAKRLPFEEKINEVLAHPHRLKLQLVEQPPSVDEDAE